MPRDGRLKLHKSKRNSNGTYSIGKTWPLEELQVIEVIQVRDAHQSHLTSSPRASP